MRSTAPNASYDVRPQDLPGAENPTGANTDASHTVTGARMDKLIECMGAYLAKCLVIQDEDIQPMPHWSNNSLLARRARASVPTVAEVMYRQLNYVPSRRELDELNYLMHTAQLATQALQLAAQMSEDSAGGKAVSLAPYTSAEPYYIYNPFPVQKDVMHLGGFACQLRDAVHRKATAWLAECDRHMMSIRGETRDGAMTPRLKSLIKKLAWEIASQATLTQPVNADGVTRPGPLDPSKLEALANAEFVASAVDAGYAAVNDMRALRNLLTLARDGAETDAAKAILDKQASVDALRRLLAAPPPELGPPAHLEATGANLNFLADVLRDDRHAPCYLRDKLVVRWRDRHGRAAWNAAHQAINRLQDFSPQSTPRTLRVITTAKVGDRPLPKMAWCDGPAHQWRFVPPPSKPAERSGLEGEGPRIVRLISLVWWLVAHDTRAFAPGFVAAPIVQNVCCELDIHASMICDRIENERNLRNSGTKMLAVQEDLADRCSLVAGEVSHAVCALSHFSLRDIHECFGPESATLPRISARLDAAMRAVMGSKADREYTHLWRDALAVLIPRIGERRHALGLADGSPSHPLADLLRTVPRVRQLLEGPSDEDAILDLGVLKGAHAQLRPLLEEVAGGGMVRALHHTASGAVRAKARVAYALRRSALRLLVCRS